MPKLASGGAAARFEITLDNLPVAVPGLWVWLQMPIDVDVTSRWSAVVLLHQPVLLKSVLHPLRQLLGFELSEGTKNLRLQNTGRVGGVNVRLVEKPEGDLVNVDEFPQRRSGLPVALKAVLTDGKDAFDLTLASTGKELVKLWCAGFGGAADLDADLMLRDTGVEQATVL